MEKQKARGGRQEEGKSGSLCHIMHSGWRRISKEDQNQVAFSQMFIKWWIWCNRFPFLCDPFRGKIKVQDQDVFNTFKMVNTDVKIIANFVKTRPGNGLTFEEVLSCSTRFSFQVLYCETREANFWQVQETVSILGTIKQRAVRRISINYLQLTVNCHYMRFFSDSLPLCYAQLEN